MLLGADREDDAGALEHREPALDAREARERAVGSTSATLTRTSQRSPRGRTSSSRVTPPPLRHDCGATSAIRIVLLAGMRSYTTGPRAFAAFRPDKGLKSSTDPRYREPP